MHSLRSKRSMKLGRFYCEKKRVNKEDNDLQLVGEAKSAMHDMTDMIVNHSSDQLGLEKRVTMLNADQRRTFDTIQSHLLHQKQHETSECQCDNLKLLQMFISGLGGTAGAEQVFLKWWGLGIKRSRA